MESAAQLRSLKRTDPARLMQRIHGWILDLVTVHFQFRGEGVLRTVTVSGIGLVVGAWTLVECSSAERHAFFPPETPDPKETAAVAAEMPKNYRQLVAEQIRAFYACASPFIGQIHSGSW